MKGALYLSSGPSGAGKDTLLLGAQVALAAAHAADPEGEAGKRAGSVEFLKRVITRDPAACTDLEVHRAPKADHSISLIL